MKLGPYAIEQDYSHYVATASNVILAVVGTASKGPVGIPTVCTSPLDLTNKFGAVSPEHLGLYAANFFLAQSSKVWFVRVASDSIAPAKINVEGTNSSDVLVADALVIEGKTAGTHYNNYSVVIQETEGLYSFAISNAKGNLLEVIKDVSLENLPKMNSAYVDFTLSTDITKLTAGTYVLADGSDGSKDATPADYITAGKTLETSNVDMNLLAIPGVSDPSVIVAMLEMVENRMDTLYLVDPPAGLTVDQVKDWHNGEGEYEHAGFNSSYGALYYAWQQIYDSVNATYVEVPPSVVVAPTIARSAKISEIWFAPAGLNRGLVKGVTKPVVAPDTNQVQYLYEGTNAVNCIINDPQAGLCVFGQKTLYRSNTALNRVNVRLLLNYIERIIVAACRTLTFEPNDRVTWNNFEDKIEPTLRNIKTHRGLYDYRIVKGEAIVTEEDIDNYRMPVKILIKPTKTAEEIPIYFNITSTGADFSEIMSEAGINLEA